MLCILDEITQADDVEIKGPFTGSITFKVRIFVLATVMEYVA